MRSYKQILGLLLMAASFSLSAQTSLPASWNFTSLTPPAGWWKALGTNGNEFYNTTGLFVSAPQAVRLDGTGENIGLAFASNPGKVSWHIRYTGTPGPFNGTFAVQESEDSVNWTSTITYTTNMPSSMRRDSFIANAKTRYIRWIFSSKGSGYNVALDDVAVEPAAAGAGPELKVFFDTQEVLNNQEIFTGKDKDISITIRNRGTAGILDIQRVGFSGEDSADFSALAPLFVFPASDSVLRVQFHPDTTITGSRKSTLQLFSNDSTHYPFRVRISAQVGNLASEPGGTPGNLNFSEVLAYRLRMAFGSGTSNAERFIVLIRENAPVADVPLDGISYQRGMWIGNSRVAYVGAPATVTFDRIVANRTYHVAVFGFNGQNGFENYSNNKATASQLTPGKTPGNYYSNIDLNRPSLVQDLYNRTRPHFQVFYNNYASVFGEPFYAYDTTDGRKVMECQYSGFRQVFTPPFRWTPATAFSREHVYPYSWMGITNQDSANYSDLHMLIPVHQDSANAVRSNFPLNNIRTVIMRFREGTFGLDSSGNAAYEPRDEIKGFCARSMFYICAAYNRPGAAFTIPSPLDQAANRQNQQVLKRWNEQFPPSDFEIARHEFAASIQNNRNPFVDNPDWACYINFANMNRIPDAVAPCAGISQGNATQTVTWREIKVWPIPAEQIIHVDATPFNSPKVIISLYDIHGRQVYVKHHEEKMV